MQRPILVPLDGSLFSQQALPVAQVMARRLQAGLALVEVVVPYVSQQPNTGMLSAEAIAETDAILKDQVQESLATLARNLRSEPTTPVTTAVSSGLILDGILEQIERNRPQLIVMTTHGRGAFSRFWLGSVADQLIRYAPVPILLVRPQHEAHQQGQPPNTDPLTGHVLIALDGSPLSEEILASVTAFAAPGRTQLTLFRAVELPLHRATPNEPKALTWAKVDTTLARKQAGEYLENIAAGLRSKGFEVAVEVVVEPTPATAILELAARRKCTAIALATHARRGMPRLLMGSVADKVVRGATMPVLVCHGKDAPADSGH